MVTYYLPIVDGMSVLLSQEYFASEIPKFWSQKHVVVNCKYIAMSKSRLAIRVLNYCRPRTYKRETSE